MEAAFFLLKTVGPVTVWNAGHTYTISEGTQLKFGTLPMFGKTHWAAGPVCVSACACVCVKQAARVRVHVHSRLHLASAALGERHPYTLSRHPEIG